MTYVLSRETYESMIPPSDRSDMIASYYKLLTDPDDCISLKAATIWSRWEGCVVKLIPDDIERAKADDPVYAR